MNRLKQIVKYLRLLAALAKSKSTRFLTFAEPGHFYSPVPDYEHVVREKKKQTELDVDDVLGIPLNDERQLELLTEFGNYHHEMPFSTGKSEKNRFYLDNRFYSFGDAVVLYSYIRHFKPKKIIEIGSGFSTALIFDTASKFLDYPLDLTCIEPYPDRLKQLLFPGDLENIELLESPVQDVPSTVFSSLNENDILLIDSSHVGKCGSDVLDIFYRVLPSLSNNVHIHFHDVIWPFEYPDNWYQEGRAWNEAYFLRVFLEFNNQYHIRFYNDYVVKKYEKLVRQSLPTMLNRPTSQSNPGNSSVWIERIGSS